MKLLERISLVQFFLYECIDIAVHGNMGFFGPNGTGKTVLADAIQTVMLGADGNRLHFNAQADGKHRARNLRSYCLGVYDVSEKGRCRDSANTYVSLVFRDEKTGEVVTAGVALSANIDSNEAIVHSLFLLPGVALEANAFVERLDDKTSRIMPWKVAQHFLKQRVLDAGGDPERIFTTNRDEFVRRLLVEYLAGPGEVPNVSQFRNAFQRSLQLKFLDDLSTSLREYLIEAGSTNIRSFKARADQFRKMSELVNRTRDQILSIGEVNESYQKVRTLRTREASYMGLGTTLQVEHINDQVSAGEDEERELQQQISIAKQEKHRTHQQVLDARDAYEKVRDLQAANVDYQQRAEASNLLGDRERAAKESSDHIQEELQGMIDGLKGLSRQPGLESDAGTLEKTTNLVNSLKEQIATEKTVDSQTIQAAAEAMSRCATVGKKRAAEVETRQEDLRAKLKVAKSTLSRVKTGLTALSDPVSYLQLRLEEEGIASTPVCDVIEITDAEWQPVIEAYLGLNTQALLIHKDQLETAVGIHRKLPAHRVAGAKLVSPKYLETWRRKSGTQGAFAAELIRGTDPQAVAFLQEALGSMVCVHTERELIDSRDAFTKDGMVKRNNGIQRRTLPAALQIGRQDRATAKQRSESEVRDLTETLAKFERENQFLFAAATALSVYGSADITGKRLEATLTSLASKWAGVLDAREVQLRATTGTLSELDELVRIKNDALSQAEESVQRNIAALSRAQTLMEKAVDELAKRRVELDQARQREHVAWQHDLYDAMEVDRLRDKLEKSSEDRDAATLIARCYKHAHDAREQAHRVENEAGISLSKYRIDFNINADIAADWQARADYCREEHDRLSSLTLAERVAQAEAALKAAEEIFRTDVVHALCNGFDNVKRQIEALNLVLRQAPNFSNRERYVFRYRPVDQHRALYDFVRRAHENGVEESLFSDGASLPAEFRELMEADADSPLLQETSPLNDYRRFFAYDIEIFREDESIGMLSKRFGPGSGGEHRVPLYVIFGAALAASYGNLHGRNAGGGLMLMDEAFDKIDAANATAVVDYLNRLGLQLIMAGPETEQTKLSGFLDGYYDMSRDGSRVIRLEKTLISQDARNLLRSDNPLYVPDLLDREIARLTSQKEDDGTSQSNT